MVCTANFAALVKICISHPEMDRALRRRLEPRQKIGKGLKDSRTHRVWKGEEMLPREWGGKWWADDGNVTPRRHRSIKRDL